MRKLVDEYYFERLSASNFKDFHALFGAVFHRKYGIKDLEQKYNTNHILPGYFVMMAFDRKSRKAVSSYGAIPWLLHSEGKLILAAQAADAMTSEDHRDRGLFGILHRHLMSLLKDHDFKILFGFPNQISYPILREKFLWTFGVYMDFYHTKTINRVCLQKLSWSLPIVRSIHKFFIDLVFRKYEVATEQNLCESRDNLGTVKNDQFRKYKLSDLHKTIRLDGVCFTIKLSDRLIVGEMRGGLNQDLGLAIEKLLRLAKKAGIGTIHYFTSDAENKEVLLKYFETGEPLPIGYLMINPVDVNFQEIKFSTIDLDTF